MTHYKTRQDKTINITKQFLHHAIYTSFTTSTCSLMGSSQVTVPVDVRRGKLRRTRSSSGRAWRDVASVERRRTGCGLGRRSGGGSEGSRKPKGELLRRLTGRSECLGLNWDSVRSYQTASARPKRSWEKVEFLSFFYVFVCLVPLFAWDLEKATWKRRIWDCEPIQQLRSRFRK